MKHATPTASGIETDPAATRDADTDARATGPVIRLPQHVRLTAVEFRDNTDRVNELVHVREYLLHPAEPLGLRGNLFVIEEVLGDGGWVMIKRASLPGSRGVASDKDLSIRPLADGYEAMLHEEDGYPWLWKRYEGDRLEQRRALHTLQSCAAPQRLDRRLVSNTWGDRSRDARVGEAFLLREIDAADAIGVDVVMIDDGWQQGRSANSAQSGGVWSGFHAADPDFWTPKPSAFPRGLEVIAQQVRSRGMQLGLWFAPDSSNELASWERDLAVVKRLGERYGVRHFKFDAVETPTPLAEHRLHQLIDGVLALHTQTDPWVVEMDITAGTRPGYFGRMDAGPVFVENRYTDWHNYWPHHTWRTLWSLSRYIDPRRLRIEWLNPLRNTQHYANDPLAPQRVPVGQSFAPLFFAQPLAFLELSALSTTQLEQLKPWVTLWKQHRASLAAQHVHPIGDIPDGAVTSGLLAVNTSRTGGYLLLIRGLQTPGWIHWPQGLPGRPCTASPATARFNSKNPGSDSSTHNQTTAPTPVCGSDNGPLNHDGHPPDLLTPGHQAQGAPVVVIAHRSIRVDLARQPTRISTTHSHPTTKNPDARNRWTSTPATPPVQVKRHVWSAESIPHSQETHQCAIMQSG